jgi:hypothetical protein
MSTKTAGFLLVVLSVLFLFIAVKIPRHAPTMEERQKNREEYVRQFLPPTAQNIRSIDTNRYWVYFDLDGKTYVYGHTNYGGMITQVVSCDK